MAKTAVPIRSTGAASLRDTYAAALVTPGEDNCCCCNCPAGSPSTYLLDGDADIDSIPTSCGSFSKTLTETSSGSCDYINPTAAICGSAALELKYWDGPEGCGWYLYLGLTAGGTGYHYRASDDPTGAWPDYISTGVGISYRNLVVT